jgi:hypothetical protein
MLRPSFIEVKALWMKALTKSAGKSCNVETWTKYFLMQMAENIR